MPRTSTILIVVVLAVAYLAMQAAKQVKATVNSVTGGGGVLGDVTRGAVTSLLNWFSTPSGRSSAGGGAQTTVPGTLGTSPYGTPLYGASYGAWGTSGAMIDPTATRNPDALATPDFGSW